MTKNASINGQKGDEFVSFFYKKTAQKSRKIFQLSDCIEITDINMPKLSNRIGCNDSPSSLVNQQTESMTEKFFKRALFPRLFQLKCDQRESRKAGAEKSSQGVGDEVPQKRTKKSLCPSDFSL